MPLTKRYRSPSSPTTCPGSIAPETPVNVGSLHGPSGLSAWVTQICGSGMRSDQALGMNGM